MQKIILTGYIGNDAVVKYTPDKNKVGVFSLAVTYYLSEKEKATIWYVIHCWGPKWDSIFKYLNKGTYVTLSGTLKPPKIYKTKSGEDAIDMSVTADTISLGPKEDKNKESFSEDSKF